MNLTYGKDWIGDEELEQLLQAIYRTYHYDFRSYSPSSLRRSIARGIEALKVGSATQLVDRVVSDPGAFATLLRHLTVQVSDLFRDPAYFRVMREAVMPWLATYPSPKLWIAGCGTGEEAYSFAILLEEAGLLDRSLIYATDIDSTSLETARAGVYSATRMPTFSASYRSSGGTRELSEFVESDSSGVRFSPRLRGHIVFSDHSLATDEVFAEVQLISCRNVLIYFDESLCDRALAMFGEASCARGFLGLGKEETLAFSKHAVAFEPFAEHERIYRKVAGG